MSVVSGYLILKGDEKQAGVRICAVRLGFVAYRSRLGSVDLPYPQHQRPLTVRQLHVVYEEQVPALNCNNKKDF